MLSKLRLKLWIVKNVLQWLSTQESLKDRAVLNSLQQERGKLTGQVFFPR